jgi:hypothetical protein
VTDRRQFLTAAGTGLAALLAGCSGRGGGGTTDESTTQTTVETTARTETQTPTETRTPTETQTPTSTSTESGDDYGDGYGNDYGSGDTATATDDTATDTDETTTAADTATSTPTDTGTPTATATDTTETVRVVADNILASAWEFVGDSGIGDGGRNPTMLTQEDGGTFADDPGVDWRDDGEEFAFTVTPELAAAVSQYICTVHARMQGDVETV